MTIGQRIRAARRARGMTQRQLAGSAVSVSFISMMEHDAVRPSLKTLGFLARRLGQPLAHFVDAEDVPVDVQVQRGETLLRQHRFAEALEALEAAADAVSRSGDVTLRARAEIGTGQALAGLRRFGQAERHLRRARDLTAAAGDRILDAAAANALGFLALRARRFAEAREILHGALARLRDGGGETAEISGKLLVNLGRASVELGLPAQAEDCFRQAARVLGASADPIQQALLHFNVGVACEQQRSFTQARAHLERAAELLTLHESIQLLSTVLRSMGIVYLEQGALADAGAVLDRSLRLARQAGDEEGTAQTLVELARLRTRQGDAAEAERLADEAAVIAARIADPAEVARAGAARAEAAAGGGRVEEARAAYEAAIAAFARLGMQDDLARACGDLGRLLLAAGDPAAAAPWLARALDLRSTSGTPA